MVFTYQGDLERVRFVLKAERAPDINMRDFGGYKRSHSPPAGHVDILRRWLLRAPPSTMWIIDTRRSTTPPTRPRRVRAELVKKGTWMCNGHGPDGLHLRVRRGRSNHTIVTRWRCSHRLK